MKRVILGLDDTEKDISDDQAPGPKDAGMGGGLWVIWICVCGAGNPPGHYCCHCGASYEGEKRVEKEAGK